MEKKKNGEGKGGKYLEQKNNWLAEEKRRKKIFREGKYFFQRETGREGRGKGRKIFGKGKYLVHGGEEEWIRKKRKYFE